MPGEYTIGFKKYKLIANTSIRHNITLKILHPHPHPRAHPPGEESAILSQEKNNKFTPVINKKVIRLGQQERINAGKP